MMVVSSSAARPMGNVSGAVIMPGKTQESEMRTMR
jgi:hypothetical protein